MDSPAQERAFAGWMAALAAHDWNKVTTEQAAAMAGLDVADLRGTLGDRFSALAALQDRVADRAVAAAAAAAGGPREQLFDGLMAGFDLLQEQRGAVLAIWKARNPPILLLVGGRAQLHLRRLALAAGVETRRIRGRARGLALAVICWQALRAWIADESDDMSATMAALDSLLDKAERAETEGVSPDLLGLPGLSSLLARLRPTKPPAADFSVVRAGCRPWSNVIAATGGVAGVMQE